MPDMEELARAAYAAYGESTGGRNYRGDPMPAWEDLGEPIQTAWTAAVAAVCDQGSTCEGVTMATTNAPVEAKVKAAGATALVTGVGVWLLGRYVFRGAVPADVVLAVEGILPAVLGAYAGWKAKHTPRLPVAANPTSERPYGG